MPGTLLLIHSAGPQADHQGRTDLVAFLRARLSPDYDVRFPIMPHPEQPTYEAWRRQIEHELDASDDGVVLVGHSVGGSVLLKYLAETTRGFSVASLFILAAPYWGEPDWQFAEFEFPDDASSKLARFSRVFLYHSRDDEEVPFAHLGRYAHLLPHAVVRELDGFGHEFKHGCPQLVADIRSAARVHSSR
jgi:uncharacterized protein